MARKRQTPAEGGENTEGSGKQSLTVTMYATNGQTAATVGDMEYEVDDDGVVEVQRSDVAAMQAHGFTTEAPE